MVKTEESLLQVCRQFQMEGELKRIASYCEGHIHSTYTAEYLQPDGSLRRYLLQRINRQVFTEPEKVMQNIERVTEHLRHKILAMGGDPWRSTINLISTQDGKTFYRSEEGEYWRAEVFIEGAKAHQSANNPRLYYNAARAFGQFQKLLADFPVRNLHVILPDFHHTGKRFERFAKTVQEDAFRRSSTAEREIEFAFRHAGEVTRLTDLAAAGGLSERVTHNDAKLDNILMDDRTGEGLCVIDLDTVMPGLAVLDFGDIVRSGANIASEDERDPARVHLDMRIYEQIVHGFLQASRECLIDAEIDQLPFGAKLIAFEQGLRFLTDYLDGDQYYRIRRPDHNLERCRVQFKLVSEMETRFDEMAAVVESCR